MKKKAFTLTEILVTTLLTIAVILMVSVFMRNLRMTVSRETAELENLQSARDVINSIRRDFAVSTPLYEPLQEYSKRVRTRYSPIITEVFSGSSDEPQPIMVTQTGIVLYKRDAGNVPEQISYEYNENQKKIIRTSSKSGPKDFPGIKKAVFKVYTLYENLSPYVPLLWVSLTVENRDGSVSKELEIAATIGSSIISQDVNNPYWNSAR